MRRAKIVATIGPASSSYESLLELVRAGMNVARLNFSHGTRADHHQVIQRIRAIGRETHLPIAILQDLRGPRLRTGELGGSEPIHLVEGRRIQLTTAPVRGTPERVHVDYEQLPEDVSAGDRILIDDGRLELRVEAARGTEVEATVVVGGLLGSNKGINLPNAELSAPAITAKDLKDARFGIEQAVDFVAMSFVRSEENLHDLRREIQEKYPTHQPVPIIAKLERHEAIRRLDAILAASDGVMVARGDLGVEVSPEQVPSLQKRIISLSNAHLRPVITATQMLESMIDNPKPTRAEASDVANAVFDGTDALMLSGETAIGEYPVEAVRTMHRIIVDAEKHALQWGYKPLEKGFPTADDAVATAQAAFALAQDRNAHGIAVFTRSGRTAHLVSFTRPRMPIWAFTPEEVTYRRLALSWGVRSHLIPKASTVEKMLWLVEDALLSSQELVEGQQFVLVASLPVGAMGPANFTYLHTVGQPFSRNDPNPLRGE